MNTNEREVVGPCLISLVVSVDVKHHVYLLSRRAQDIHTDRQTQRDGAGNWFKVVVTWHVFAKATVWKHKEAVVGLSEQSISSHFI